jgi:hypothetical protein
MSEPRDTMELPEPAILAHYPAALGLLTGSIWGYPTWGTWWEWGDARLVSVLVLFFIYLGYIANSTFRFQKWGIKIRGKKQSLPAH